MTKRVFLMLLVFITCIWLTGCVEKDNRVGHPQTISTTPTASPIDKTVYNVKIQDDFKLEIFNEKEIYNYGEPINVYAQLTYIGELDQVQIGHAMSPVGWNMHELTRDIPIYGAMATPYILTTLDKNKPLTFELTGLGGYSEQDDQDIIELNKGTMSLNLLKGSYTVSATAGFQIDDPQFSEITDYHFHSSITLEVE